MSGASRQVAERAPVRTEPREWPEYCCAILRDDSGPEPRYMLERRPETARHAPGVLACFGGARETGEHPNRCLRRELKEELGWSAGAAHMDVVVRLMGKDGRVIAWFYRGRPPRQGLKLRTLPGSEVVWVRASQVKGAELSGWHRAAMEAEGRGEAVAWVDG